MALCEKQMPGVCGHRTRFEHVLILGWQGNENLLNLTIGDSSTISILLNYLYTLEYENKNEAILVSHVNMYVAADFYDTPVLKMLAAKEFKACLSYTSPFLNAIETVFNNVPSIDCILRDHVLDFVMEHARQLLLVDGNAKSTAFTELMDRVPELGRESPFAWPLESRTRRPP